MEGEVGVSYESEDTGKIFRSFNLISQHFEDQPSDTHLHIFNRLPIALLVLKGVDYIIESINDVNLMIWGKGREIIGKPLLQVMPEFGNSEQIRILNKVYKTGKPVFFKEMPISITRNGKPETGFYTLEYQPVRNSTGIVTGLVITGFEVTSYVIARSQLQESEQKFKDMIEYAPVSIAIYRGHNIVFEFANENYLLRINRTYEELIGKPFFEILPEFKGQGLEEIIEQVLNTGKPHYAKTFPVNYTRNGKKDRYYSDFVYYPLRNACHEVDGFMVIQNDISDLINFTSAAEESEHRFRNLVMQSPVAMGIFLGEDLVIDMANDALLKIWCRTEAEVKGKELMHVFPELEGQPFPAWLKQVYRTGKTLNQEETLALVSCPQEEMRKMYVQLCYTPLRDMYNTITGIVITVNNITAQVEARKHVEENESYFRKMADNVPAIIFLWKSDGFCTYKNRQWFEYTGASEEDAQGFSWFNYIDINSRPEVQQTLFSAIKNKASLKVEFQLRRKDGKYRWFEKAVVPRFNDDGQMEGYIGTMTDIHERKLAEEQLKDAEERLRLAAEATGMGTFDMDMQTFAVIHSPRLLQIFGLDNNEEQNKVLFRYQLFKSIHPDDVPLVENALNRAFQTGIYNYEARIIVPDQSIRWIRTEGKIFYSHFNKPMRMIGMVEDISRRKQLERHKDDFLGIVSHELKTPVTSLKVYVQLLQEQYKTINDATSSGMLHKMDNQVNRLILLIKDLLDTARIETGTLQVDSHLFDLNRILNEVMEELPVTGSPHRIIKENNQSFMVIGDAARTAQVIFSLISNAVKYSPQAHEVIIHTQQKDKFVFCGIQDFGMGIAPENLFHVFEKYFRISNKMLGTYPGLGLGLFMSAQIIRQQGGDIWAESEEGKGATFWFSLPLAATM